MAEWTKVAVPFGSGLGAGVVDEVLQNMDDKREDDQHKAGTLAAAKKLPVMKRIGTYLNYGVPILSLLGIGTGFIKGETATTLAAISGQLAGREAAHTMTHKARPIPAASWTVWERVNAGGKPGAPPLPAPAGSVLEF